MWIFLILLTLTVSIIAYYRVKLQMDLGPIFDTYDYLADAALFAGKGIGFSDFNRPPVLSLLTSLFFVYGGLSVEPVMIVDGILYIFGCIGLYLFLKNFFDSLTSFIGSLLFATFPIVITFAGAGFNDVSSVSIAIWAVYLTYLGVNRDSRFFLISFALAMIAFLTRYNMALLIFPIIFYILINRKKIKKPRNILIGIILAIIITIPLLIFFNNNLGSPIYPFLDFFKTSGGAGATEHFAYNTDSLYFIKNMPSYIGVASLMIVLFTFLGLAVRKFRKFRSPSQNTQWMITLKNLFKNFKFVLVLVLAFLFFLTFSKVHYMISEFIFLIICYLTYLVAEDFSINLDKDLLFVVWFMAFFIFQSVYVAKDHRYFISMVAPLAYFLTRGFSFSVKELKVRFKDRNLTLYVFAILLTVIMLPSVTFQFQSIEKDNQNSKLFNQDAQAASYWLMNYDHEYKSKLIYADLWSYFGWFLQTNVGKMPVFRNNQRLYAGAKDYNFTQQDKIDFNNELENLKPDYYIGVWPDMNFTFYQPIQRFGTVTIYRRI
jgi:4-amino-4-deoxy-L-arabinose transferase-like glycosyltransferase